MTIPRRKSDLIDLLQPGQVWQTPMGEFRKIERETGSGPLRRFVLSHSHKKANTECWPESLATWIRQSKAALLPGRKR